MAHKQISIAQAESKYSATNPRLGLYRVPFGLAQRRWKSMLEQMQDGDELWEYSSSDQSWEHFAGRAGIALIRDGQIIDSILTSMN